MLSGENIFPRQFFGYLTIKVSAEGDSIRRHLVVMWLFGNFVAVSGGCAAVIGITWW